MYTHDACETSGPLAVCHHGNRRRPTRSIMAGPRVDLGTFLSTGGARDPAPAAAAAAEIFAARAHPCRPATGLTDFHRDKTTAEKHSFTNGPKPSFPDVVGEKIYIYIF